MKTQPQPCRIMAPGTDGSRLGGRGTKTAALAAVAARAATAVDRAQLGSDLDDVDRAALREMAQLLDAAATATDFGSDPAAAIPEQSSFVAIAVTIDAAAATASRSTPASSPSQLADHLRGLAQSVQMLFEGGSTPGADAVSAFFSTLSEDAVRSLGSVGERQPRL